MNPELKGKPLAVAGNPMERRGIIITCSYEARAFGVKTTMNVGEAKRLCKDLIVVPPNFERYREASFSFFSLLRTYSPILEPVSIDEGYLDITDYTAGRHPLDVVEEIQHRIYEELGLPCSIGVAPNKFLAKTASDMKKPMGITVLRKRDVESILWPLDVIDMHGVGQKTAEKLRGYGIKTIGDLATAHISDMKMWFGVNGERMVQKANGIDERAVDPEAAFDTKSVGNSTTLPRDETEYYVLKETFSMLSNKVANRLQAKSLIGTTVSIMIRDHNWRTITRAKSLQNGINRQEDILEIVWELFLQHWDETPLRLIGVTVSNVSDKRESTEQLDLFNFQQYEKEEPILKMLHKLERQFGEGVVQRGVRIKKKQSTTHHANTSFSKDFLDDFKFEEE
ncbi:MAG: DNA polymerase IV [Lysinibacillus sp.]